MQGQQGQNNFGLTLKNAFGTRTGKCFLFVLLSVVEKITTWFHHFAAKVNPKMKKSTV